MIEQHVLKQIFQWNFFFNYSMNEKNVLKHIFQWKKWKKLLQRPIVRSRPELGLHRYGPAGPSGRSSDHGYARIIECGKYNKIHKYT
jgi:hypothetical protein